MRPGYLEHNKSGPAAAVKISDKTKQEGYQQGVNGISPQIICCCQDHLPVPGEETGHPGSVEEGYIEHEEAHHNGGSDSIEQCFPGTVMALCPYVLGHESRHGLHIGRGDRHQETAEFFCHADACRNDQPRLFTIDRITRKEILASRS